MELDINLSKNKIEDAAPSSQETDISNNESNCNITTGDQEETKNVTIRNESLDIKMDPVETETVYNEGKFCDSNQSSKKVLVTENCGSEEILLGVDLSEDDNVPPTSQKTGISNNESDCNITTEDQEETKNVTNRNESLDIKMNPVETETVYNEGKFCDSNQNNKKVLVTENCGLEEMELDVNLRENNVEDVASSGEETGIFNVNATIEDQLEKSQIMTHTNEISNINKKPFEAVDIEKMDNEENDSCRNEDYDETFELDIKQYRMEISMLTNNKSSHGACSPSSHRACSPSSHGACSPTSSLDEDETTSDISKRHTVSIKSSLPYFHLPKPNLDEFLMETEKNLCLTENTEKIPVCQERIDQKDKGDIVFDIEKDEESNRDIKSKAPGSLYQKLESLNKLENNVPGFKRSLLKGYLKNEIDDKKVAIFNKKKEIERYNHLMDQELDCEINDDVDYESSDEDLEEATISFDKENESHVLCDESGNSPTLKDNSQSSDDDLYHSYKNESKSVKGTEQSNYPDTLDDDSIAIIDDESSSKIELIDDILVQPDDDLMYIRSKRKKAKVLEDSDDECQVVSISKVTKKFHIEEDSDSVVYLSENMSSIEKKTGLETNDTENACNESSDVEINSSIPSFQPHGGFVYESQIEEEVDAVKAAESKIIQVHKQFSISIEEKVSSEDSDSSRSDISLEAPSAEEESEKKEDSNQFGFTFDHPPIPDRENESVFSSQDIANVCSGVFKNDTFQETRVTKDEDETSTTKFCEPTENAQDFFEMEAELSGDDDDGDDEEEDAENDNVLDILDDNEIAHDEDLREDIAGFYMKQKRNEDFMAINFIQEQVIPDGELDTSGNARQRKFVWQNKNNPESAVSHKDESSDSEEDTDVNWMDVNKEKAKFLQEKGEDDILQVHSACKKPNLKMKILGRPEFVKENTEFSMGPNLSAKRPRNSFLNLDEEACQIAKKIKTDEAEEGSRTIKHVLFMSDKVEDSKRTTKEDSDQASCSSVFNKLK